MTEREKMLAGEMYSPTDPELMKERHKVRLLFHKFNSLSEAHLEERQKVLCQILENAGENVYKAAFRLARSIQLGQKMRH